MGHEFDEYLKATEIIDSEHPAVKKYALKIAQTGGDVRENAVKLYLAVRDQILYDPYSPFYLPEHYRASVVLERGRSFCIPKASLLCALGRVVGIPTRIGFATVRNHLATRQLIEYIGSDIFVYHGFVEFYIQGKWVKATPAFNKTLCIRHGVMPLEFNGRDDSLFHTYNLENRKFMEYIEYHGTFADVPVKEIVAAWVKAYGAERVENWKVMFMKKSKKLSSSFYEEDIL